jgi:Ca2+-binding EF-hand superfamily protein
VVKTVPLQSASPTVVNATTSMIRPTPAKVLPTVANTAPMPAPLAGPAATQSAYETKHSHDAQLANLKEVRKKCGLKKMNVKEVCATFKEAAAANEGKLSQDQFADVYDALLKDSGHEPVSDEVKRAVFDLFDRDDNGTVDMMELICGVSLLCKGDENAKVEAVFMMFDDNGDGFVSENEMKKFLITVFKVVCTPKVMEVVSAAGVQVTSIEDMASATVTECFSEADLDHDGKLSLAEFKRWFHAPRNDPAMLFTPVKELLN